MGRPKKNYLSAEKTEALLNYIKDHDLPLCIVAEHMGLTPNQCHAALSEQGVTVRDLRGIRLAEGIIAYIKENHCLMREAAEHFEISTEQVARLLKLKGTSYSALKLECKQENPLYGESKEAKEQRKALDRLQKEYKIIMHLRHSNGTLEEAAGSIGISRCFAATVLYKYKLYYIGLKKGMYDEELKKFTEYVQNKGLKV